MEILRQALRLADAGEEVVLVTLVDRKGKGARPPGARMAVAEDGRTWGSIGGGRLEKAMRELADEILASGRPRLVLWQDPDAGGCGGACQVFLEPLVRAGRLFIVGAGHVGVALARQADLCGRSAVLFDDRPRPENWTGAFRTINGYDDPLSGTEPGPSDAVVICTRSHATDLEALRCLLGSRAGFIGLLGSRRKREEFFATLAGEGVGQDQLARVVTPVGLDIGARTPAEIAVAVMAQLIGVLGRN